MTITKLTSREFSRNVGRAKRAADDGPVIVTYRGHPAYALLRHDTYQRLAGGGPSILEILYQPGAEDIEFDPPRLGGGIFRAAD